MIYTKICTLCRNEGISISQLEKKIGMGNGTIGRWEKSSPKVDNLQKVATYFGVTLDSLLAPNEPTS